MEIDKNKIPDSYDASQIEVLEGLEAVRKRPGMYIGSTSLTGAHHLIWEIVDNSIDEAMADYADEISIQIKKDNIVEISDNGRGIPVDIQHKTGRPASETVFTVLHAGGKFGGGSYKVSGGLHGVGAAVVNALSKYLEYEIYRDGKIYHQRFEKGIPVTELEIIGESDKTGSLITFRPDEDIFKESIHFDFSTLANRVQELAYLNRNLLINLTDNRDEEPKTLE
ncbi:MAG: ATP-binding protein, partial [Atopostipes suicloacalis]|nr:ATP-binding protein [Atopostipes suicloacalis]